jgi:hypothetical protein
MHCRSSDAVGTGGTKRGARALLCAAQHCRRGICSWADTRSVHTEQYVRPRGQRPRRQAGRIRHGTARPSAVLSYRPAATAEAARRPTADRPPASRLDLRPFTGAQVHVFVIMHRISAVQDILQNQWANVKADAALVRSVGPEHATERIDIILDVRDRLATGKLIIKRQHVFLSGDVARCALRAFRSSFSD